MKRTEHQKTVDAIREEQELTRMRREFERSRSITVGTAFGGTTEISMSGDSGSLWCVMQPVEVVELIHQLAANVGCHIHLQPRDDFSTWRNWRVPENEKQLLGNQPPFSIQPPFSNPVIMAHDFAPKPPPSVIAATLKEQKNDVATKKTINRRNVKSTSKSS